MTRWLLGGSTQLVAEISALPAGKANGRGFLFGDDGTNALDLSSE